MGGRLINGKGAYKWEGGLLMGGRLINGWGAYKWEGGLISRRAL